MKSGRQPESSVYAHRENIKLKLSAANTALTQ